MGEEDIRGLLKIGKTSGLVWDQQKSMPLKVGLWKMAGSSHGNGVEPGTKSREQSQRCAGDIKKPSGAFQGSYANPRVHDLA